VQKRRAAFGAGLVELHHKHNCHRPGQYGVGLWSQNRPEWQITGDFIQLLITCGMVN
jgi:long-chain acyl-CoA synthetase